MPRVELTARLARESKAGEKDTILFDKELPGFGLRIHPSGRKVWIVQTRIEGRSRRMVIARYGEMTLARARQRARDMLERIRAGANPAEDILREKRPPTVKELAQEYLRRCDPYWKLSGRKTVRIYLKARILPAFGSMPVDRVAPEDVAEWFDTASKDKPGAANRAFEILRSMMFRAEEWGFRERGTNPCVGIRKNPRRNIARFLDSDELARLGRALDAHASRWPEAVAAIRLLALTGCRRSEVLNLRWRDIQKNAIVLPDSKTGPRLVPLGESARAIVDAVAGSAAQGCVPVPEERRATFPLRHRRMLAHRSRGREPRHASAPRLAPHCRQPGCHVWGEPAAGGQTARSSPPRTTAGYAHLADAHLVETAEKLGRLIGDAMNLRPASPPSRPRARREYGPLDLKSEALLATGYCPMRYDHARRAAMPISSVKTVRCLRAPGSFTWCPIRASTR